MIIGSGQRPHAATIFPPVRLPPIIDASVATYAWILSGIGATRRQMMFVASRPGVAGGEKARRAATIMEFAHVSGAGQDDVAEIVWIGAETIAGAQFYQVFGMICI